ncbi:MAG: metalloregulator ArsR/SmtB family transcription factor [Candidatus Latescibacterota bacterium]|nr:metalloregulator ArsR/SmtB family transcription factor [Candidatus Latescibacterota bacterium]
MEADLTIFKACSDSTRLRILFLLDARELCVCELVDVLQMPQGKISRHLAVLKIAGLVHDRRDATWFYYSLAPAASSLHAQLLGVTHSGGRGYTSPTEADIPLKHWIEEHVQPASAQ